ncbi:Ornithine carbamoyltransferase, mitochondrial [Grifola frondosa]|uniref:ornithine carbamoyltransferase n=1 Tax=Grifola frondosa TaxID=5627 RepID=A0A1C7M8Y7_GRIFR|nr:Ornithine carbamoyltransferase, mitochondrial [Grifola frondosa]
MTLADLSPSQIDRVLARAYHLKQYTLPWMGPWQKRPLHAVGQTLRFKTIALLFSKRSTRTRISAETAALMLGGQALFLGKEDIQLGVNESVRDSGRVIGGLCQGIFARVGEHEEIEELAKYSPVPVLNALSSLWHPTQVLADLLTLHEQAHLFSGSEPPPPPNGQTELRSLPKLQPLTIAYVGDSANVLHDMLVTYPRLGHKLRVASPENAKYRAPKPVWDKVVKLQCDKDIVWTADPKEAVNGADLVVTDTWISMGQEAEKEQRLKDFQGYQITEQLCREGGAKENWKFMHCLPRKPDEVDDEVFYGPRSMVFEESDNRKWTIMALFDLLFGQWLIPKVKQ